MVPRKISDTCGEMSHSTFTELNGWINFVKNVECIWMGLWIVYTQKLTWWRWNQVLGNVAIDIS